MAEKVDRRKSPEFAEASRIRALKMMRDPKRREEASARMKTLNQQPDFAAAHRARTRDRMNKVYDDPIEGAKLRRKAGETMTKNNKQHLFKQNNRARSAAAMTALNADPEFRAASSDRMRELHRDPEFAAAHVERLKARHAKKKREDSLPPGYERLYERLRKSHSAKEALRQVRALVEKESLAK